MSYKYDVFLSYSSTDVGWAAWLEDALQARSINVYRDKSRLTAGDEWQPQLQEAIEGSRHLVVLWSAAAGGSDWVDQERIYFEAGRKGADKLRKLVFVNLEGDNKAQARYEQINNINQAGIYAAGASSLSTHPDVRKAVLDRLEDALVERDSIPIYKVLMVSTLSALQNLPLNTTAGLGPEFGVTLQKLNIRRDQTEAYKDELAKYYSDARSAWKPFGAGQQVDAMLDVLRDRVNSSTNQLKFRWRDASEDFWSRSPEDFELALTNISQYLALIVIDPISLYDADVTWRLSQLRKFLKPERCATAVLAPFSIPDQNSQVRLVLRGAALDMFREYSEPTLDGSTLHPLTMCAHDDVDVRRVLCSGLDQSLMELKKRNTPAFLSPGERR